MSRLIRHQSPTAGARAIKRSWSDRLEQVAKYVPSEVITAHVFLNGVSTGASTEQQKLIYHTASFVICLVFTPIFFQTIAKSGDNLRKQQIVSTVAFVVWSYSIGNGIFATVGLYNPITAAFILTTFTLVTAVLPELDR